MLTKIIFAVLSLCTAGMISAASINFDDIDASAGDINLDTINPYQGLNWTNFSAYTTTPGFPGFNNGIVSFDNAAYSGGELLGAIITPVVGKIESAGPFDFVSAYLGAGYYDNLSLTVEGRLHGSLLFTQSVILNTTTPLLVNFGFTNIDELDFIASTTLSTTDPFLCGAVNCTQFTLDDLVYISSPVPEPSGMMFVGLTLIAAIAIRRRINLG